MSDLRPSLEQVFRCHAILLAAGLGRRFDPEGHLSKLNQIMADGATVIEHSARHLTAAISDCHIVTRANSQWSIPFNEVFSSKCTLCTDADFGMAHSLVWGLQQLPVECDAVVIALADMPLVKTSSISAIRLALENGASIAVPVYRGQRGNPVGFSKAHFAQLLQLRGDQGARALLQTLPVCEVEVDDPGILRDIDTPDDLLAVASA